MAVQVFCKGRKSARTELPPKMETGFLIFTLTRAQL